MGFPSPATDYVEQRITIDSHVHLNQNTTYIMLCGGHYPEVGILKGSMMAVDRSRTPGHGHIVVATVGGEFVMRRLLTRPCMALQELGGVQTIHNIKEPADFMADDSPVWGVVAYVVTDTAGLGFRGVD
jgi:DNA polymerase V